MSAPNMTDALKCSLSLLRREIEQKEAFYDERGWARLILPSALARFYQKLPYSIELAVYNLPSLDLRFVQRLISQSMFVESEVVQI